ncbi:MAG: hypothetical protein ACRYGI_10150 [Janthinobacterium lividum]
MTTTMPILSDLPFGRLLAAVAAMSVSACAMQGPADPPTTRFDGIYTGTQAPDSGEQGCGAGVHSVRFEVSGTRIWIHTHHRHRHLDGTVDAGGQVAMGDGNGTRTLTGTIVGNQLTAIETTIRSSKSRSLLDSYQGSACTTRIDAIHGSTSGAAADPPD